MKKINKYKSYLRGTGWKTIYYDDTVLNCFVEINVNLRESTI